MPVVHTEAQYVQVLECQDWLQKASITFCTMSVFHMKVLFSSGLCLICKHKLKTSIFL